MEYTKQLIDENLDRLHNILNTYKPFRNEIGLLPDGIRSSEDYQKAKKEYDMWFKRLQAYNKAEMKRRKANGTYHYVEIYGVRVSRMEELFFQKYITNNNIAMNTLTPEERTKVVTDFINAKFPK